MRKIGNFLRALFRALKTTALVPVVVAGDVVHWIWRRILGSPAPDIDVEEQADLPDEATQMLMSAVEDRKADREREEKLQRIARSRLPSKIKSACKNLDNGLRLGDRFFEGVDDEAALVAWVRSLDSSDRLTVRHMPGDTLGAHISGTREQGYLPSYVNFDRLAAADRVAAMREAERTAGWDAKDFFADLIQQCIERGDIHQVDQIELWVRAQQLAGIPEDEIDHGP